MFARMHTAQSRLLIFLFVLLSGLGLGQLPSFYWITIIFVALLACGAAYASKLSRITLSIMLLGFLLGLMRSLWALDAVHAQSERAENLSLPLAVAITSFPQGTLPSSFTAKELSSNVTLSVTTEAVAPIARGSILKISGKIIPLSSLPESYAHYLTAHGHAARVEASPDVILLKPAPKFWKFLGMLRSWITLRIAQALPQEAGSFITALLLGSSSLPRDLAHAFRSSGLQHIVAVSGTHVTMLALFLAVLARTLGIRRNIARSLTLATLGLYILLVGAPSSAIRAGIMGGIGIFALMLRQRTQAVRLLLYATVGMLLYNPLFLYWDVGFRLSVFAMIGLISIAPRIENLLPKRIPAALKLMLSVTVGAQIATLPVLLGTFERLSPYGIIANILTVPASPILFGLVGIIGIGLMLPASFLWAISLPAVWLSNYIIFIARLSSSLPYASLTITPPVALIAILYLLVLIPASKDLALAFTEIPENDIPERTS